MSNLLLYSKERFDSLCVHVVFITGWSVNRIVYLTTDKNLII
jgi:hypothetical protein